MRCMLHHGSRASCLTLLLLQDRLFFPQQYWTHACFFFHLHPWSMDPVNNRTLGLCCLFFWGGEISLQGHWHRMLHYDCRQCSVALRKCQNSPLGTSLNKWLVLPELKGGKEGGPGLGVFLLKESSLQKGSKWHPLAGVCVCLLPQ